MKGPGSFLKRIGLKAFGADQAAPGDRLPAAMPEDPLPTDSARLPDRLPRLLVWLLARWWADVRFGTIQAEALKQATAGVCPVFVTRHASRLEVLLARIRFERLGLPCPVLTPGQSFWFLHSPVPMLKLAGRRLAAWLRLRRLPEASINREQVRQVEAGKVLWLPLVVARDMFSRPRRGRRDPLAVLLEARHGAGLPLTVVPVMIFYGKRPAPAGEGPDGSAPGLIQRMRAVFHPPPGLGRLLTLMADPGRVLMEVGPSLGLDDFLCAAPIAAQDPEGRILALRRELLERIDRLQHSITGPVPQSFLAAEHTILTAAPLQDYLRKSARRRNLPLYRAQREAAVYLREIAARPSPLTIGIGMGLAGWLVRRGFDGISVNSGMLRRVREAAMEGPVVFVPCHRSHMDTVLIGLILHHHNISLPLVFAGRNLAFWPLGPLARRMGAFFVRRSFQGKVLYVKVMETYVRWLLGQRYNVLVYIEGTRSRSGRLLPPQLGMLAMLLASMPDAGLSRLNFIPVSIGYDRVPEEGAYLHETRGVRKAPESARQLLGLGRFLRRRYGRIYLKFGAPVGVGPLAGEEPTPIGQMNSRQIHRLARGLGRRIMGAIDRGTVITPHALAAGVVLAAASRFGRDEFRQGTETLLAYAGAAGLHLADTLTVEPMVAMEAALADFAERRWIASLAPQDPRQAAYRVVPSRRLALAYYQNSILSRFAPAAQTALVILARAGFQFSAEGLEQDLEAVQDLLALDLFPDPSQPAAMVVRRTIEAFVEDAILVPHPLLSDTYGLTAAGYRKLILLAGLLASLLESYAAVLEILMTAESGRPKKRDPLQQVRAGGRRMLRRGLVTRPEALALGNLSNAIAFFAGRGIRSPNDAIHAGPYRALLRQYLEVFPRG